MEQPPSCGHGVQTEIQGLVGTPLCMPPRGSQGVVLLSPKVWNGRHVGENLAIGIACFTNLPPLTGDQTHTHTHTHTQSMMLSERAESIILSAPPAESMMLSAQGHAHALTLRALLCAGGTESIIFSAGSAESMMLSASTESIILSAGGAESMMLLPVESMMLSA